MLRRIEVVLGVLTAVAGVLGVAAALFAPSGRWESEAVRSDGSGIVREGGTTRLIDEGIGLGGVGFFVVVVLAAILVGLGADAQGALGDRGGFAAVFWPALLLFCATVVSAFSIGFSFAPAALLVLATAVVSAIVALTVDRQSSAVAGE